jgi:hypothetical protein
MAHEQIIAAHMACFGLLIMIVIGSCWILSWWTRK